MERFFTHEQIRRDQPVTFLSDGGDTVRQAQFGPRMFGEWILDWFHIAMRLQNLIQGARGLPEGEDLPTRDDVMRELERAKWYLWHGCGYRAIDRLESVTFDLAAFDDADSARKPEAKVDKYIRYIDKNRSFIVDYAKRYRYGDPIATGFVASAVNQVVRRRFVKKQQMSWSMLHADRTLQVRTAVLNEELRSNFECWYPSLGAANDGCFEAAA